jgi:hypothetical protein
MAMPVLVGVFLALVVVGGHLLILGEDLSIFVRAALPLANPDKVSGSLRLLEPEQAYDGEFFYRLAVDPWVTRDVGIILDNPSYRQQRILYPLIARFVSLGQDTWVPVALVAINIAGLAVLGGLGAQYAVEVGAPVWLGSALPLWAGFTFTLARDLSEIVQACFLVGTLLALRQGRWRAAGLLMPLAVLTRETAVILAVVLLAWSVIRRLTARDKKDNAWFVGAAGLLCYLSLQAALWARWGTPPLVAGATNVAIPLSGPIHYWAVVGTLGRVEIAMFSLLAVLGLMAPRGAGFLRLSLILYLALLLTLSTSVWTGDVAWLRAATEAAMLAWLLIFHGRMWRGAGLALAVSTACWPAVARWAIST